VVDGCQLIEKRDQRRETREERPEKRDQRRETREERPEKREERPDDRCSVVELVETQSPIFGH
jgi:hypothetical protein